MSFILFVRGTDDLPSACREAGALLAFRRHAGVRGRHDESVLGIWMHHSMIGAPVRLTLRRDSGEPFEAAVTESFGVSGIWELGRIEPIGGGPADWAKRLSSDSLPEGLLSLARDGDAARKAGIYAPVFPFGTPMTHVTDEMSRLRSRYSLRLAGPVFHDRDTGRLFPDES